MNIVYHPSYKEFATKFIAIHNTGGLGQNAYASTQHLTPSMINAAHKDRFGMLSTLGHWGGYNFYMDKDGIVTQFRAIGEETAANRGHNFNGETISICLAGNFTKGVDTPTFLQITACHELFKALPFVPRASIVPHRSLQAGTDCYGSGFTDSWARDLFAPIPEEVGRILRFIIVLLTRIHDWRRSQNLNKTLGAERLSCDLIDTRG